jgi:integrase
MKLNLTQAEIAKLKPKAKRYKVLDAKTAGLAVIVYPTGSATYIHYRKINKRPERQTLGDIRAYTIEQARDWAGELNTKIAHWKGADYSGVSPIAKPRKAPTLAEVRDHYIKNHVQLTAKNPTASEKRFKWELERYMEPLLQKQLSQITRSDVRQLHADLTKSSGGVTANHMVKNIRVLYNHATNPDVALYEGANPARDPKKFLYREVSRDRVLHENEFPRFFEALQTETHRDLRDFLLLAISTAARMSTILSMRWSELDWKFELWSITNPKGRAGTQKHVVPLNSIALTVLKAREAGVKENKEKKEIITSEFVFPGRTGHLTTVKKPLAKFMTRAKITDLHLHDLRRSLATAEGESGASRELIQKTIGHVGDSAATKIYDRSQRRDDVREAIENGVAWMLRQGKTTEQRLLEVKVGKE